MGGAHGDEEEAVDLTGDSADGERQRAGGAARRGRSRPGQARTAMRRRRWTSPATARTGSGGERVTRWQWAEALAGGPAGRRRRPSEGPNRSRMGRARWRAR